MEMHGTHAIVLRSFFPYKYKVVLFDKELGKIEAIALYKRNFNRLMQGALIECHKEAWNGMYRLHAIDLKALPAQWVCSDILFLHHVLEIADLFLQTHNNAQAVFDLFMFLYQDHGLDFDDAFLKKIFLCRFFSLLGIYPEEEQYDPSFFNLILAPINTMLDVQRDTYFLHHLMTWLQGCVSTHPYAYRLKTMNFLTKMDMR